MGSGLLTNHMSLKEAFAMHASKAEPFDGREGVKGVTVRLSVQTRAHLIAMTRLLDMTRQDVLEELINGGLSEALNGYLEEYPVNSKERKEEIEGFYSLAEEIEAELRKEEKLPSLAEGYSK